MSMIYSGLELQTPPAWVLLQVTQAEVLAVLAASAVCPDENRWSMAEYMAWFDDALSFFTANP